MKIVICALVVLAALTIDAVRSDKLTLLNREMSKYGSLKSTRLARQELQEESQQKNDKARRSECSQACRDSTHGTCTSSGGCVCENGWTGDDCSLPIAVITDGVAYTDERVRSKQWIYFQYLLDQRARATLHWHVVQTSAGDVDLYVRRNGFPSRTTWDARDVSSDVDFTLHMSDVDAGVYYAGVYGFTSCAFTLRVDLSVGCPNDCSRHGVCLDSGACRCNLAYVGVDCSQHLSELREQVAASGSVPFRDWRYFVYNSQGDATQRYHVVQDEAYMDCDVYVRGGSLPSWFHYDVADTSFSSDFTLEVFDPAEGPWYIGVYAYGECAYTMTLVRARATCGNECSGPTHGSCVALGGDGDSSQCQCAADYEGDLCERRAPPLPMVVHDGSVPDDSYYAYGFVDTDAWAHYRFAAATEGNVAVHVEQLGALPSAMTDAGVGYDADDADCDLYVRRGAQPSLFEFDERDVSLLANVELIIEEPGAAIYYFSIFGYDRCYYRTYVSHTLRCPLDCSGHGQCGQDGRCTCGDGYSGEDCADALTPLASVQAVQNSLGANQWHFYSVHVTGASLNVNLFESATSGYLWLYVAHNDFPTLAVYDYADQRTNTAYHSIAFEHDADNDAHEYVVGVFANPWAPIDRNVEYTLGVWIPFQDE
jgi:hypothetical protein